MNQIAPRTYSVEPGSIYKTLTIGVLGGLACLYGLWATGWKTMPVELSRIWLALLLLFLAWAVFFVARGLKWRRSAVSVDAEGLWPARLQREKSLVRWEGIAAARFRRSLRLVDAGGKELLAIDYQLRDYPELLQLVAAKIAPPEVTTYSPNRAGTWAIMAGSTLASLPGFYYLFTTRWHELSAGEKQVWLSLLISLLAICAFFFRKGWKRRTSGVAADAEGIWPAHLDRRNALVAWERIAETRDRFWRTRLDLLDRGGQLLMSLDQAMLGRDPQWLGAEGLADLLAMRIATPDIAGRLPAIFSLPKHYYFLWIGAIAAAALLIKLKVPGIFLAVVIFVAVLQQIRMTARRLEVFPTYLVLKGLLAQETIDRELVRAVAIRQDWIRQDWIRQDWMFRSPRPQALLVLKNGSVFTLHFAAIDALSLKRFLDAWLLLGQEDQKDQS